MNIKTTLYIFICTTLCFLFSGCTSEQKNESDLIHINVSTSYPEKEIKLEDVADIEYLQLEVNEDFLFREAPGIITEDKIIIGQRYNGDILVFSRDGKPLSKFNRKGGGPGDYPSIYGRILYDETSDEIFVRSPNKIMAYSSSGEFRRMIPLLEGSLVDCLVNYDSGLILLYDENDIYPAPFSFVSKEDGSVVESIDIPSGKKVLLRVMHREGEFVSHYFVPGRYILWYNDGYLLTNYSTDTVYFFSHEKELSPIFVRMPTVHSMDPMVTLHGLVEAGNYEFLMTSKFQVENGNIPITHLMRDKKTGSVYRQKITFNDYRGKQIYLSPEIIVNTQDSRLGLIVLSLVELQEANNENKLSGKLKQIVENSDEDGNDIYMLLHFR